MDLGRHRWVDGLLATLGAAFGAVSLTYPFGRDQGLYFYVGREWVLRGAIPYRDVFDHKTPGIYVVHALCVAIFGETLYGIRIADLLAVLAVGWLAGAFVAAARNTRGRNGLDRPRAPLRGVGAFVSSVLFFGFLNFIASCEGEVWVALTILVALRLVQSESGGGARPSRARLVGSGAFAAMALLVKPTAALLILVVLGVLVSGSLGSRRSRRSRSLRSALRTLTGSLVAFAAGAGAILGLTIFYFAWHGALRPFQESVLETNRLYVREGSPIKRPGDLIVHLGLFLEWFQPFSAVLAAFSVVGIGRAIVRTDRDATRSYRVGVALVVAAWVGIMLQGKFFQGHWGVMIAGGALVAVNVAADGIALFPTRSAPWAASLVCTLVLALYARTERRATDYLVLSAAAVRFARGQDSREVYLTHFREFFVAESAGENEACGNWLRDHTTEADFVAVRAFQPQVYAIARRRYPGRFFWTGFVYGFAGVHHRDRWLAEDRQALAAHPPKYVTTFASIHDTSEGPTWWIARGYTKRTTIGDFTILERTPETATVPW